MTEYQLPEGMDGNGLRLMAEVIGSSHLAEQLTAWADAINPPEPEPEPDYRPPSIADGTVEMTLIEALRHLSNEYGLNGVRKVLEELADPPIPKPVITDEMVEAYAAERYITPECQVPDRADRADLEAVERLGWLRDPELLKRDGKDLVAMLNLDDDDLRHIADENMRLSERLEMAEGLLRLIVTDVWIDNFEAACKAYGCSPVEAEYLRSLDGEGESDE